MKKFQTLGKSLAKNQQKMIMGGDEQIPGGEACNCNSEEDCASNPVKKKCYNGAAYSCTPDPKVGWCEA